MSTVKLSVEGMTCAFYSGSVEHTYFYGAADAQTPDLRRALEPGS